MPQFGSNQSMTAQNLSATQDINGNAIISSDNTFGGSPLGIAARTQALYGLPNGHFDLTNPDPNSQVEVNNAIPYWDLEYSGTISTKMVFDATTQNWSVRMDPTGAAAGDFATLKARTYLLNDDALALRQKAYASLTKVGTTGTAQWSIVLSATYYDIAGAQLSTYNIGTAADTGTWTGINGVTTSGSAAISTQAAYADIALTLTAAGSVSGTAKVDINSVLVATSQATTGSFVVSQTFLASGTWTRPTGVEYVTVVAMGAGQSGASGGLQTTRGASGVGATTGGDGGASGPWLLMRDLYVGGTAGASVSVGIGAGAAGGTANVFTKGSAVTTVSNQSPRAGAWGGNTTFGSYISVGGGTASFTVGQYKPETVNGFRGGNGGYSGGLDPSTAGSGFNHQIVAYTSAPFSPAWTTTSNPGNAATGSGGSTSLLGAGGSANAGTGIAGAGGGGGGSSISGTTLIAADGAPPGSGGGGGGGGASARRSAASNQTVVITGGNGANASPANTAAGGGGGGAVSYAGSTTAHYDSATLTMTSGAGGASSSGWLVVSWIG